LSLAAAYFFGEAAILFEVRHEGFDLVGFRLGAGDSARSKFGVPVMGQGSDAFPSQRASIPMPLRLLGDVRTGGHRRSFRELG
jgi:hypothetical protein